MSRTERISKLDRAVREYRGVKSMDGVWKRQPNPGARVRVEKWLGALKLDVAGCMTLIDNFQRGDDFRAWLRSLYAQQ